MSEKIEDYLNPRQRKFVHFYVVVAMAAGRAYEAAGYTATGHSADVAASKLLTNIDIQRAVKEAKREVFEANRWEKWELVQLLQQVLETAPKDVDEGSRLAQEVTRDEVGGDGDGVPSVVRAKIKMMSKKDAAKMLAELNGWNETVKTEDVGVAELARQLAEMRNTGGR